MLVKYNNPNVLVIGVPNKREKNQPLTTKMVRLQPGVNKIGDEDWKIVKKHPKVELHLENKVMEIMTEKDGNADKALEAGEAKELSGMKAKEAVALVKECTDFKLLTEWSEVDERATVQTAIAKQLEKLK